MLYISKTIGLEIPRRERLLIRVMLHLHKFRVFQNPLMSGNGWLAIPQGYTFWPLTIPF